MQYKQYDSNEVESNNILPVCQSVFQRGRGTVSINRCQGQCTYKTDAGRATLPGQLDFSRAFKFHLACLMFDIIKL